MRGAESDLLTESGARALAAKPGVRLLEIAGAGHAPSLMNDAQIEALQGFLAES